MTHKFVLFLVFNFIEVINSKPTTGKMFSFWLLHFFLVHSCGIHWKWLANLNDFVIIDCNEDLIKLYDMINLQNISL